jgi:hypothetical protein
MSRLTHLVRINFADRQLLRPVVSGIPTEGGQWEEALGLSRRRKQFNFSSKLVYWRLSLVKPCYSKPEMDIRFGLR